MMSQLERRRSSTRRLLHPAYNVRENVIKVNVGNTMEHELAKFLLSWEFINQGQKVVTEAIFLNGKRADVLILDTGEAYEILQSETSRNCDDKISEYPVKVTQIKARKVIDSCFKKINA